MRDGVYVSTAWLTARGWTLLMRYMELTGIRRIAEAVRSALFAAAVEIAQGRGLRPPEAEPHPRFEPQLGRLREVAVRLPAAAPLQIIKKHLRDILKTAVSSGLAVEWALATAINAVRQKPAGLPEPVRDMLRIVLEETRRAPPGERRRIAVQQLWLRMDAARRLAKELRLPVDRWLLAIIKEVEVSRDPLAVLWRYINGEVPRADAGGRLAETAKALLKEAGTPEGLRRLWWRWRDSLMRSADGAYERELVGYISSVVEESPEEAWRLLEAVASGRRPEVRATRSEPRVDVLEVEEKLALFDKVAEETLRDPEGVERGIYKRAEFFEAFYRWAKAALRGDLPERIGMKLKSALEVAYYCRPGGLLYAAGEALEARKPLPPEHPGVYALKNYARTWLHVP